MTKDNETRAVSQKEFDELANEVRVVSQEEIDELEIEWRKDTTKIPTEEAIELGKHLVKLLADRDVRVARLALCYSVANNMIRQKDNNMARELFKFYLATADFIRFAIIKAIGTGEIKH